MDITRDNLGAFALGALTGLVGAVAATLTTSYNPKPTDTDTQKETVRDQTYFTSFDELRSMLEERNVDYPSVALGDLDGDGDLDVLVVSDHETQSIVYENRIPQGRLDDSGN